MALFNRKKNADAKGNDAAAAEPAPKRGVFGKLVSGLGKTMSKLVGGIGSLVMGRRIDDDLIDDLEDLLIQADLGPDLVDDVTERLRGAWRKKEISEGEEIVPFLKEQFKEALTRRGNDIVFAESGPTVILVVGVNGTGKTTSIGKLAWHFKQQGKRVLVAAGDTFRAAAESQLKIWAEERVGADFHQGTAKQDPSAVAYQAAERAKVEGHDILIIDTAGRLHTQKNLMEQLAKIKRVVAKQLPGAPHEVLLVVDANFGQNAVMQAEKFIEATTVTGLFLAKLDATGKGGVVLQINNRFDIPVKFVGLGEQKEDYALFDAEQFVDALFAQI
jgi:fused signal recognition particle receptor